MRTRVSAREERKREERKREERSVAEEIG